MTRKSERKASTQVPRTAADVLADGWQEGDDFEISFIVTAPTGQQQNGTKRSKRPS